MRLAFLFLIAPLAVLAAYDVVIVGAGIGGLSAAYEAAARGGSVAVVDMSSVFGGHAVMSEGGLFLVDTPLQRERGIRDSADLAFADVMAWGEDADARMARVYVERSREEVYDWLTSLGVRFNGLRFIPGNRVSRFHENDARGLGLVRAIYRECLKRRNIRFVWNTEITAVERGAVIGRDLRTGAEIRLEGESIVLATGGYESNLEFALRHWPDDLGKPARVLSGGGVNAKGKMLEAARKLGAATERLDHQWIYPWGLEDPRFRGESRGLNVRNPAAIWVNLEGQRFVDEGLDARSALRVVLRQPEGRYWMVFDSNGIGHVNVSGTDWTDPKKVQAMIVSHPGRRSGATLDALRIPGLAATVARYNQMVSAGTDASFGRFTNRRTRAGSLNPDIPPMRIDAPPFYALPFFPVTRKSMGGLKVDEECRVLSETGEPLPGIYAVGEITGFGGFNGKKGLEGTFLGPALFQGRIAGRTVPVKGVLPPAPPVAAELPKAVQACETCHDLTAAGRSGYYHFEKSHAVVRERRLPCTMCHPSHRIDAVGHVQVCAGCHLR